MRLDCGLGQLIRVTHFREPGRRFPIFQAQIHCLKTDRAWIFALAFFVALGEMGEEETMLRLTLVFLLAALITGALGLFKAIVSGIAFWILFGTFLILAMVCISAVLLGFGGKHPMD